MFFTDNLAMGWNNLRRRKLRTFLTCSAITISTLLIVVMVSMGVGGQNLVLSTIKEQAALTQVHVSAYPAQGAVNFSIGEAGDPAKVMAQREASKKQLTSTLMAEIARQPGVKEVRPLLSLMGNGAAIEGFPTKAPVAIINGCDPAQPLVPGSMLESQRLKQNNPNLEPLLAGRSLTPSDKNGVVINEPRSGGGIAL